VKVKKFSSIVVILMLVSCKQGTSHINIIQDFDYWYTTIEKCFLTAVTAVKIKKVNQGLDKIETMVKEEESKLKQVGFNLAAIIPKENEMLHYQRVMEKYTTLSSKYTSYLQANFTPIQKDRFVSVVVEGVAMTMVNAWKSKMPKNAWELLKKARR